MWHLRDLSSQCVSFFIHGLPCLILGNKNNSDEKYEKNMYEIMKIFYLRTSGDIFQFVSCNNNSCFCFFMAY